jgi:hypothetical protein
MVRGDYERRGLARAEQEAELGTQLVASREEQRLDASAGWLVFD